jgi:hypothetical protein
MKTIYWITVGAICSGYAVMTFMPWPYNIIAGGMMLAVAVHGTYRMLCLYELAKRFLKEYAQSAVTR